ncbi:MAG: DUF4340 domain-containing protein [Planctomycetes bacterium]|nr:DUF4340 domain-containing protein [Planctomycetota bacterium]
MNEQSKTITFIAVAAGFALIGWFARPATPTRDLLDDSGQEFFASFTDPLEAASLEIIDYDEDTSTPRAFKVARYEGVWSIPSHENYAADAENRFAEAATSMMGLIKGSNISDSPADHEMYGVIDPLNAQAGAIGVGKRIKLESESNATLVDLIVGKEVKDQADYRYVRQPGKSRVYLCAIKTDKLTTKFEDWIERDLLKLNANNISQVVVNDYSIDEINRRIVQGDRLTLNYNKEDRTWALDDLADSEALIDTKITEMKNALSGLKIVDVYRKPEGLSAELRADDAMELEGSDVASLSKRGYYIIGGQLLSNKGEMYVRMNDGVQYTLHFGEIALGSGSPDVSEETSDDISGGGGGANRYLFVTVGFNKSLLPEPELEIVPDIPDALLDSLTANDDSDNSRIKIAMAAAREKTEVSNSKKLAEYEEKLISAQERVTELKEHFADWYYVISDSVFEQIRLTRSDVVEIVAEENEDDTDG